jgi:biopolymer transport protein ExbD
VTANVKFRRTPNSTYNVVVVVDVVLVVVVLVVVVEKFVVVGPASLSWSLRDLTGV